MDSEIAWTLQPADSATFVGDARTRMIGGADAEVPVKLYYVRFEPAARTNWHIHSGTQIIVVCAGRCRYQREGEAVREAGAGESVRFEAGIRHWHGAAAGERTEHIAINLENARTTWLEPVSDEEHAGG